MLHLHRHLRDKRLASHVVAHPELQLHRLARGRGDGDVLRLAGHVGPRQAELQQRLLHCVDGV